MTAAQLAQATFVAGAAGTCDDIYVQAFDGQLYSGWDPGAHVFVEPRGTTDQQLASARYPVIAKRPKLPKREIESAFSVDVRLRNVPKIPLTRLRIVALTFWEFYAILNWGRIHIRVAGIRPQPNPV